MPSPPSTYGHVPEALAVLEPAEGVDGRVFLDGEGPAGRRPPLVLLDLRRPLAPLDGPQRGAAEHDADAQQADGEQRLDDDVGGQRDGRGVLALREQRGRRVRGRVLVRRVDAGGRSVAGAIDMQGRGQAVGRRNLRVREEEEPGRVQQEG